MKIGKIGELLAEKFKGKVEFYIGNPDIDIVTLLTDSRNHIIPENTLFFAIKTRGGNDGHRYIKELYGKGVRNFIVEYLSADLENEIKFWKKNNGTNLNFIVVPDVVEALTEIGRQHRRNAEEVVAIVGSRGKTTIKEMLFQTLESDKKISRSPRSYNSKIGVPLSLWQIPSPTEIALIEAGISQKGEMQRLADAIAPDTVILTNIGEAHAQGFASDEEKAYEKAKIAYSPNVKTVIYPANQPLLEKALSGLKAVKKIRVEYNNPSGEEEGHPLSKTNNIEKENKALVKAYLKFKGFSEEIANEKIRNLNKINTRMNVSQGINGCVVVLDSYTADLSSLVPAIDFISRRKSPSQTKTLIAGDLLHEGKNTDETYREFAGIVNTNDINRFIGIGETLSSYSYLFPSNSLFFKNVDEFLKTVSPSEFNDEIILLKAASHFDFVRIFEQLEAKKHETVLEINLDALLRNYNYFRSQVPASTGIIAMVKASGYGAGSYEIAKTLQDAGAAYLAVAALDEGIDLRNNGITMPIMVMNPRSVNYRALFNNRLEPVIYSFGMLESLITEATRYGIDDYPIHIKLDTGMHRMGFEEKDLDILIDKLKCAENIRVTSIFSHLATADCIDMDDFTLLQLERFERMSVRLISSLEKKERKNGISNPPKRHILNSAGILRFPAYHYDMVRLGIGLYGANTLPATIEKPLSVVSTLRSVIICIREIEEGEAVGYSRKGVIRGKRKIATIPIGYADGMNRHFGNGAVEVIINGKKAPTIGNICMDATMIDVTGIECKEGDSVEIFGENLSVQALADTLDTIPYEILTSISPRVKRIYYRE